MNLGLYRNLFFLTLFFFCINLIQNENVLAQTSDDAFEVYLDFNHRGIINDVVVTYYLEDVFFIPAQGVFNIFQVENSLEGLVLSGRFGSEQASYLIDLESNIITFEDQSYPITTEDYILTEVDFYLPPRIYSEIFGLDFSVDFSNLTLNLETEKELPIIQSAIRRQRRRIAERNTADRTYYPLLQGRNVTLLDGGFLDYSLSSNFSNNTNAFNYNSNLGLQLVGGDLQGSVFGVASEDNQVTSTDNLRWRYLIRETPLISEVTVGQTTLDGVLTNEYTGIRIANDPIEPRRFFDEFEVQGNTFPESEVELYLNNALVGFEQADELGNYRFLTPLYYGSSQLDVRIYGPTGQIIERRSRVQVPFSFQPKGTLNYKLNAGILDNPIIGSTERSMALQGNMAYGLTPWLTLKGGVEYYETDAGDSKPSYTGTASLRFLRSYILSFEGVTDGYYRATINSVYPNAASFNIDYTNFTASSGIYNAGGSDQQLVTSFFYPLYLFRIPLNMRASAFTRVREGITFTTFRYDINTRIQKLSLRMGFSDRYIDEFDVLNPTSSATLESSATYNFSRNPNIPIFLRGTFLRAQARYLPAVNQFQSSEFLVSRNLFSNGRLQVSYGRNYLTNSNTIRASFVIDLIKTRSSTTATTFGGSYSVSQTLRGSIGYDPNYSNFLLTSRNQVGRSGAALKMYVDNNNNNRLDEGDEEIPEVNLRLQRSGASERLKNGVLYYTQLQPYFRYNMEINKASITNPMLVPQVDQFSVVTDPNTFKKLDLAFYTSGLMEGYLERVYQDGLTDGIGGVKLLLRAQSDSTVKEIRSFSDGSFYEYPIPPGKYELFVDPSQLDLLNMKSIPEKLDFEVVSRPDGDFIEGLSFQLVPRDLIPEEEEVDSTLFTEAVPSLTLDDVTDEIRNDPEIIQYENELLVKVEEALRLIILTQNEFYERDFEKAFEYIEQSLQAFETAQGYALKGSILYFQGKRLEAVNSWRMALRFDPDIFIPTLESLDQRVTVSSSD
ncbi:MAG: hypothetical protein ED557_02820 [Balneola sp.]|nr:MAG: hypothetical protein ED557_02820 [Balneola sp.]